MSLRVPAICMLPSARVAYGIKAVHKGSSDEIINAEPASCPLDKWLSHALSSYPSYPSFPKYVLALDPESGDETQAGFESLTIHWNECHQTN